MMVDSTDPARRIAGVAVTVRRTHPTVPAIDVLDLAFKGADPSTLVFTTDSVAPRSPFGQLIAEAFDQAMPPTDWFAWTGPQADPNFCSVLLGIWSTTYCRGSHLATAALSDDGVLACQTSLQRGRNAVGCVRLNQSGRRR